MFHWLHFIDVTLTLRRVIVCFNIARFNVIEQTRVELIKANELLPKAQI